VREGDHTPKMLGQFDSHLTAQLGALTGGLWVAVARETATPHRFVARRARTTRSIPRLT